MDEIKVGTWVRLSPRQHGNSHSNVKSLANAKAIGRVVKVIEKEGSGNHLYEVDFEKAEHITGCKQKRYRVRGNRLEVLIDFNHKPIDPIQDHLGINGFLWLSFRDTIAKQVFIFPHHFQGEKAHLKANAYIQGKIMYTVGFSYFHTIIHDDPYSADRARGWEAMRRKEQRVEA